MTSNKDELNRVDALHAYNMLNTDSDSEFDKIIKLAAAICDAPVAKINLLDEDKQWTKSDFGANGTSRIIPRNSSVCQYTIQQNSILEVPDLSEDPRFKDLKYVTTEPKYKYYLGAQLTNPDGYTIGALCVLDFEKRRLSNDKKKMLQMLADQVMTSLELRKQNHKLTELNEQKNRLMKILSHDLRSPLSGIIGMSELLEELVAPTNKEALEMASLVNQSAKQLNQLIDDILNYTIIESKGFSLHQSQTDVHSIVENLKKLYMPSAKLKNIEFNFDVDVDQDVYIDGEKFEQIFGNLISNALKFTPQNGHVESKVYLDNNDLVLNVRDTGIGMKKEITDTLFENFGSKQQKGTSGEKSTGLGLNIVKHFTDLHNGTVHVESTPGGGSSFTVRLPISKGGQTD